MVTEKKRPMEKFRRFFAKIGKRNLIIALAVVLIGAAVWINVAIFADRGKGYDGYDKSAGMTNTYGDTGKAVSKNGDDYFTTAQASRSRARDEALEVLSSVVNDKTAAEAAKTAAYTDITKMAKDVENEANIETLVLAKGFTKCVAVINGDEADIIVSAKDSTTLTAAQLSQINEIVYTQTGIKPEKISVIPK